MRAPRYATLVGLHDGQPRGRVRIMREYKHVVKVCYWMSGGWSDVQDTHPDTVRMDGGKSWGWDPMTQDDT